MRAQVIITIADDGSSRWDIVTDTDGITVAMLRPYVTAAAFYMDAAGNAPVLTQEVATAVAEARRVKLTPPEGWAPSLDGHSTNMDAGSGAQSFTKRWVREADGASIEVPCAPDGSTIPATVVALRAFEEATPLSKTAEA